MQPSPSWPGWSPAIHDYLATMPIEGVGARIKSGHDGAVVVSGEPYYDRRGHIEIYRLALGDCRPAIKK